jgi:hypothetical protein
MFMIKRLGLLLFSAVICSQANAKTDIPTLQMCQQLYEDIRLLAIYSDSCPDHEQTLSQMGYVFGEKVESILQPCEKNYSQKQFQAIELQTNQKLMPEINKAKEAQAKNQSTVYCQSVKKDLQHIVQKYLPNQDVPD